MNRNTNGFESEFLKKLSESYSATADELSEHRSKLMQHRSADHLSPDEVRSLNERIDILYVEICELRSTATHLSRLAAPPTEPPGMLGRGRRLS